MTNTPESDDTFVTGISAMTPAERIDVLLDVASDTATWQAAQDVNEDRRAPMSSDDNTSAEDAMAAVRDNPSSVVALIHARMAVAQMTGDTSALHNELNAVERALPTPQLTAAELRDWDLAEEAEAAGLFSDDATWTGAVQEDPADVWQPAQDDDVDGWAR